MGNNNKKDTVSAAKNKIKADRSSTKKDAKRNQGALADREVRLRTPKNDNGRAQ
ncbi:hypothetical protein AB0I22_38940 [Streptomyces sp. NPDC050610]|uniref:hypothetical protein n=1 Tax=Streptomyces sp. NPDC050610 TaxID=3157097 RepID=UPI003422F13A